MLDSTRMELLLVTSDAVAAQQYFEGKGYRVLTAEDCSAAMHLVQGHAFDVLLIDLDCQDQPEFLQRVRKADGALQIIVLSDKTPPVNPIPAGLEGVEILRRPMHWPDLNLLIRGAAQVTRLRRENLRLMELVERPAGVSEASGGRAGTGTWGALTDGQALQPAVGGAVDLETINRAHVLAVLDKHRGNKAQTARALGINRRSLYRLLEKYNSTSFTTPGKVAGAANGEGAASD